MATISRHRLLRGYLCILVAISVVSSLIMGYLHLSRSSEDSSNFWKNRREMYVSAVMNAYAGHSLTSVKTLHDNHTVVLHMGDKRRTTLDTSLVSSQHLNLFIAFIVDFVSGSHDTIVPVTSLRQFSASDLAFLVEPAPLLNDIVAVAERPGGIYAVQTTVCSASYKCPQASYDPSLDDDMCDLKDARGTTFPLEQLDHLFALDFLLGNHATRTTCTLVPNRSQAGSLLSATNLESCCCGAQSAIIEDNIWLDKTCNLHPRIIARFSQFWPKKKESYKGKSLAAVVKEYLSRKSIPRSVKLALTTHEKCLGEFYKQLDERLDILMDAVVTQCLDKRETLADDYIG